MSRCWIFRGNFSKPPILWWKAGLARLLCKDGRPLQLRRPLVLAKVPIKGHWNIMEAVWKQNKAWTRLLHGNGQLGIPTWLDQLQGWQLILRGEAKNGAGMTSRQLYRGDWTKLLYFQQNIVFNLYRKIILSENLSICKTCQNRDFSEN